jgi:hypothetical protein
MREVWYNECFNVFKYIRNANKDLDIQFLPDNAVKQMNQQIISTNLIHDSISTHIVSTTTLAQTQLDSNHLDLLNDVFHYFWTNTITIS